MTTRSLDFLVIGAQKGGTTSLFEYLRTHPDLFLPAAKEVPFFTSERRLDQGFEWFLDWAFEHAPPGVRCGKVTTAYMAGSPDVLESGSYGAVADGEAPESVVPKRIRDVAPDVRLIAMLRDPVARCVSQYRMAVLDGREERPLDVVVDELLERDVLAESRRHPRPGNAYVTRGEYGRILEGYLEIFPREQLHVSFQGLLDRDPEQVVREIFAFIGVDPAFVPPNLGERHRSGASARRLKALDLYRWQGSVAANGAARRVWRALPRRRRDAISRAVSSMSFRVDLWNRRPSDGPGLDGPSEQRLRDHFRSDAERLERLLGVPMPWLAAWDRSGASVV